MRGKSIAKLCSELITVALLACLLFAGAAMAGLVLLITALVALSVISNPLGVGIPLAAVLSPTLIFLALVHVVMRVFDGHSDEVSVGADTIRARVDSRHPRYRWWRLVYDRLAPQRLNTVGPCLRAARGITFWFLMCGYAMQGLSKPSHVALLIRSQASLLVVSVFVAAVIWRLVALLEDLIGDIKFYAGEDTFGAGRVERDVLIEQLRAVLAAVVAARPNGRPYDRIVVAGHSLGSAITLEALVSEADAAELGDNAAARRLRAIDRVLLFGSPVELFQVYFRHRGSDERRRREELGRRLFGKGIAAASGHIALSLVNLWALGDPISAPIGASTATNVRNEEVGGLLLLAHASYTTRRRFWEQVLPLLLGSKAARRSSRIVHCTVSSSTMNS